MISIFKKPYKSLYSNLKKIYTNLDSKMRRIGFDIFLAMTFIVVIFIFSSIIFYFFEDIHSFSNLVAIYSVIGVILSSLFIFIMAEGLRDKEHPYKIEIFFNESKLITIIILFLISLTLLLFQEYRFVFIMSFLTLLGFIGLSIYAVRQMALITLNSEELWEKHIDLFKNEIKEVTKFFLNIKSESEKFYNFIQKQKIKTQWFISEFNQVYLKSLQEGVITNVNLEALKNIIKDIEEQEANKPIPKSKKSEKTKTEQSPRLIKEDIILNIPIGKRIKRETDLLSYNKEIQINTHNKYKIEKKLNKSIKVKKTTIIDKIKGKLENYRSMIKKYIEEENTFQFTRYFKLYFRLAEEFLNELPKPYSYQEAKREINFVLDSSWPQLDWLRNHTIDFFSQARDKKLKSQFKTEHLDEIYIEIKWFSYHLIDLSKEKKDHLLFQMALRLWVRQLYGLSQNNPNQKNKDIEDHIVFFKKHLISTVFRNALEEGQVKKETEGYLIYLLEITKDISGWMLKKDKHFSFVDDLENIIKVVVNNGAQRSFRNQTKQKYFDKEKVFKNLESYDSRKLQFLLGLGAFLESLTENKLNNLKETIKDSILKGFELNIISFDLKNFLNIYPLMKSREINSFWQWSFFINTPADGQWRKGEDNTEDYFLKLMLDIPQIDFERLKIEEIDSQTLSDLEYLKITINQKPQKPETEKIYNFLQRVSAYQNQNRAEYINKGKLEQDKVLEFRNRFKKGFKETAYMRNLFKNKKVIQQIKDDSIGYMDYIESKGYFMFHQVKPNDINLSLSHPTNFSDETPEIFSYGCSDGENKILQSKILEKCEKQEISYSDFKIALTDRQWTNNEVILVSNRYFSTVINAPFKIEEIKEDNKSIFEYNLLFKNRKIPLKMDFLIKNQNVDAVIFDISKLPILEMFNPIKVEEELFDFHFLEDIGISIGIDAFSSNDKLMEFIIKNPPDWLIEKGSKKDQREYLKQMVNIKILQGLYLNWEGIEGYIGEYFVIKN